MKARAVRAGIVGLLLALGSWPAGAQPVAPAEFAPATPASAAICGDVPLNIARMSWPSAELLAEIHARVLRQQFGCTVNITPGDLAATASSMGSTGQPAIAPEMWITRIAEVWNAGVEARQMRQVAPSFADPQLEGWFIPGYVALAVPELTAASGLATALPIMRSGVKVRFISCPPDWACSVINRNLIAAYGLEGGFEIVEPANRFEMDTLIAEAVNLQEPVVFYYWRPNAILAQFDFRALDMGAYDPEAAKCLAQLSCPSPRPSAFVTEPVVIALSEWVFTDIPDIAAYFQRASMPLTAMDQMLAQLNEPGATLESVADRFISDHADIWGPWVGMQ